MSIYEESHLKVAHHFGVSIESMRSNKRRYVENVETKKGKPLIWEVYAKAYAYDMAVNYFGGGS